MANVQLSPSEPFYRRGTSSTTVPLPEGSWLRALLSGTRHYVSESISVQVRNSDEQLIALLLLNFLPMSNSHQRSDETLDPLNLIAFFILQLLSIFGHSFLIQQPSTGVNFGRERPSAKNRMQSCTACTAHLSGNIGRRQTARPPHISQSAERAQFISRLVPSLCRTPGIRMKFSTALARRRYCGAGRLSDATSDCGEL